jgi:hypothetical protein
MQYSVVREDREHISAFYESADKRNDDTPDNVRHACFGPEERAIVQKNSLVLRIWP